MPQLASLFSQTPEVIALATKQARTISLFYFLLAYSHAIASICRGAGKAFVPMMIMLSVWCVFRILYITTVMHISRDIQLIYWAYPITWSIRLGHLLHLLSYVGLDPRLRPRNAESCINPRQIPARSFRCIL